jgi:hypothetical protein
VPEKKLQKKRNVETSAQSKTPTKTANTGKVKAKTKVWELFQFIFRSSLASFAGSLKW